MLMGAVRTDSAALGLLFGQPDHVLQFTALGHGLKRASDASGVHF